MAFYSITKYINFNNKIEMKIKALTSYRVSCIRERREIANLYNEKAEIANLVTHFKNNNGEYLKIKRAVEEKVKDVLTNGKLILKFATFSVIESLRTNPELYNFISYSTSVETNSSYGSNYLSLISSQQQYQQLFNDSYTALILEEAEKLYNELTTELTNRAMVAAAAAINFRKSRPDTRGLLLVEPPRLVSIICPETCVQCACDKKRSGY